MQSYQSAQVLQHWLAHCASSAWGCTVPRAPGAAASCWCQSPAAPTATTPDAQAGPLPSTPVGCCPPLLQGAKALALQLTVGWCHCVYIFAGRLQSSRYSPSASEPSKPRVSPAARSRFAADAAVRLARSMTLCPSCHCITVVKGMVCIVPLDSLSFYRQVCDSHQHPCTG
jgi:hypothetical protein